MANRIESLDEGTRKATWKEALDSTASIHRCESGWKLAGTLLLRHFRRFIKIGPAETLDALPTADQTANSLSYGRIFSNGNIYILEIYVAW